MTRGCENLSKTLVNFITIAFERRKRTARERRMEAGPKTPKYRKPDIFCPMRPYDTRVRKYVQNAGEFHYDCIRTAENDQRGETQGGGAENA